MRYKNVLEKAFSKMSRLYSKLVFESENIKKSRDSENKFFLK
jgi:hypothetical protein